MIRLTRLFERNKYLKPLLLFWLRHIKKTINLWPEDDFIRGVMDCYERHMGYRFDLCNPRAFTEKLQWYKVFYHRNDFINITDKYLFKKYIKDRLGDGYTIPCFGAWYSIKDLENSWMNLPEEFVLKSNLQSDGRNIKIVHKKSEVHFRELKYELKKWLKVRNTLLNSWDWHFYDGTPCILAEEYMANYQDQLFDYKFFCFDGTPFCVYVAQDHFGKDGSHISFYDLEWNKLNVQYGHHIVGDAQRPKHFEEMVAISKKLSQGFPFIRVDFFDTEDHLYVAELTFDPGGGVTPYYPQEFNDKMGELFVLT